MNVPVINHRKNVMIRTNGIVRFEKESNLYLNSKTITRLTGITGSKPARVSKPTVR